MNPLRSRAMIATAMSWIRRTPNEVSAPLGAVGNDIESPLPSAGAPDTVEPIAGRNEFTSYSLIGW
ncbi:hypothetical protein [Kribbella yunnanensis]